MYLSKCLIFFRPIGPLLKLSLLLESGETWFFWPKVEILILKLKLNPFPSICRGCSIFFRDPGVELDGLGRKNFFLNPTRNGPPPEGGPDFDPRIGGEGGILKKIPTVRRFFLRSSLRKGARKRDKKN